MSDKNKAKNGQQNFEEELSIQKRYFEELFNSATEAIIMHDNNDIVLNVNSEFTKMFGYTREESLGKRINDLVADAALLQDADNLSASVLNGEFLNIETQRKRKDGTYIDVSILGAPIRIDNIQTGVYAIYRDISLRKKAEAELIVQKTLLEELFNSAPEAIVLHDNNDIILNINNEFTALFGYTKEEALGRPINELVTSEEELHEANGLSKFVQLGERVNIETKRRQKNGKLIDVSILGAPIIKDGEQFGVFVIYRDITERIRADILRLKNIEETKLAQAIQAKLLPGTCEVSKDYELCGNNIPALDVGGDYYDFIPLDENRFAIALGDVSGKGLPASMIMANVQATIRSQAYFDSDSDICLDVSNKLIYNSIDNRTFVSLFYGIVDTKNHTLSYANAGQNMPIILSKNKETRELETRGPALGLMENFKFSKEVLNLSPEDILIVFSDGITEAMNENNEEYGDTRLFDLLKSRDWDTATELNVFIFDTVLKFFGDSVQNDDMTMIVMKRNV